jgi:hypothetical protein
MTLRRVCSFIATVGFTCSVAEVRFGCVALRAQSIFAQPALSLRRRLLRSGRLKAVRGPLLHPLRRGYVRSPDASHCLLRCRVFFSGTSHSRCSQQSIRPGTPPAPWKRRSRARRSRRHRTTSVGALHRATISRPSSSSPAPPHRRNGAPRRPMRMAPALADRSRMRPRVVEGQSREPARRRGTENGLLIFFEQMASQ